MSKLPSVAGVGQSLCLLGAGAALQYLTSPEYSLKVLLAAMKATKQCLKYGIKTIKHVKLLQSVKMSPTRWLRSPEVAETIVYVVGVGAIVYSKWGPIDKELSLQGRAGIIVRSFWKQSKKVLCCYQVIAGLSDLAQKGKLPVKEFCIAGSMVLASYVAKRYFK